MLLIKKYTKIELSKLPFMDTSLELEKRVEDILSRLTLDEKIKLGGGRLDMSSTKKIKRLGIKPFKMTDGPHGVGGIGLLAMLFKKNSYFPVSACRAATWNPELLHRYGIAIAEEIRAVGFHMILSPGINIVRSPLCGRNFEYFTEDPYLVKKLAVAEVKGYQSLGIAACVKHFAVNNQDTNRFRVNAIVSERALEEIYLPAFEATVREGDAWSFMACYNKVNNLHGCENTFLLKKKLMDEWGFRGFVVSDWFASKNPQNTESCINAGLSLEMPWSIKYKKWKVKRALKEGFITEEKLDDNVRRLLRVMFLVGMFDDISSVPKGNRNTEEHQLLAREIAEEGIVLLKNENDILPLNIEKIKKIAVLGPNAKKKHSFGGGSSSVRAFYEITPLQGIEEKCGEKVEIVKDPALADVVIFFGGLKHAAGQDAEGADKKSLELPKKQVDLINKTVKANSNTIVVLISGSPIAMEGWLEKIPALIEAWYPGMEGGHAIANVIFGEINPSGKLPVTFPKKLSDSPANTSIRTFPGRENVYYDEGIFVGYRHYDTKQIEPLFPFGFGLSYTSFEYQNLKISPDSIKTNDTLKVSVDITNSGNREGAEIVQLYVQDIEASVERPLKELKGFKKIKLNPEEKKTVEFELLKEDLSFYDEKEHSWRAEKGKFKLLVGSSSRDIRLEGEFNYID
ncbi:MAG: glycosyl hydrolase [Candidatus Lokiarchaeota archaeon]|nr:glycosyl hydrolase [Candidatus Lokiarchaeota archaeon]